MTMRDITRRLPNSLTNIRRNPSSIFDEKTVELAKEVAYHHRNVTEPEGELVTRLVSILRVVDES